MQYQNGTTENALITANEITLYIRGNTSPWRSCRVIKRDGKLIAQTSQGIATVHELQIPEDAIIDQSDDGTILVMFDKEDATP